MGYLERELLFPEWQEEMGSVEFQTNTSSAGASPHSIPLSQTLAVENTPDMSEGHAASPPSSSDEVEQEFSANTDEPTQHSSGIDTQESKKRTATEDGAHAESGDSNFQQEEAQAHKRPKTAV